MGILKQGLRRAASVVNERFRAPVRDKIHGPPQIKRNRQNRG